MQSLTLESVEDGESAAFQSLTPILLTAGPLKVQDSSGRTQRWCLGHRESHEKPGKALHPDSQLYRGRPISAPGREDRWWRPTLRKSKWLGLPSARDGFLTPSTDGVCSDPGYGRRRHQEASDLRDSRHLQGKERRCWRPERRGAMANDKAVERPRYCR
jgi:hypothetical protein